MTPTVFSLCAIWTPAASEILCKAHVGGGGGWRGWVGGKAIDQDFTDNQSKAVEEPAIR